MSIFKSPKFWEDEESVWTKVLLPVSDVYSFFSRMKLNNTSSERVSIPVVCVGNVVLGGAGKTPTVELVCSILKEFGYNPHILTGGYGGYIKNVVKVDPSKHYYLQVGDEALLSSMVSPTWIGRNRVNSAKAAILSGADILVMDDGFQNNSLQKDFKILVIDSKQGIGNGHLFPAGPLRESVESAVMKSDIVFIVGEKNSGIEDIVRSINPNVSVCYGRTHVTDGIEQLKWEKVIGFCGLGYPEKFKCTILDNGLQLEDFIAFSDHHPYTITEIQKLIKASKNTGAKLVTTRKDYIKIPDVFKNDINVIDIKMNALDDTLKEKLLSCVGKKSK